MAVTRVASRVSSPEIETGNTQELRVAVMVDGVTTAPVSAALTTIDPLGVSASHTGVLDSSTGEFYFELVIPLASAGQWNYGWATTTPNAESSGGFIAWAGDNG